MGQRTFRNQLADTICKEYLNNEKEIVKVKEKLVDIEMEFILENPLEKIKNFYKIKNGIINHITRGNERINNLKIIIRTILSQNQCYLNLNFHVLFGFFIDKDINKIEILIFSEKDPIKPPILIDNRSMMNQLIDFMVFKSKVNVVVNNKFIYHILPGFKNHSIVLTYKNTEESFNSDKDFQIDEHNFVESILKDFMHHPYSEISCDFNSFQTMKLCINKQLSNNIKNIILPVIDLTDYNRQIFIGFFKFLSSRFKFVSLKLRFDIGKENKSLKIIEDVINDVKDQLKEIEYTIVAFDIYSEGIPLEETLLSNSEKIAKRILVKEIFKKVITNNDLQKLCLVDVRQENIVKNTLVKEQTIFGFIYYNRKLIQTLTSRLCLFSKKPMMNIKKKKFLLIEFLEFCFGKNFRQKFLITGEYDFSIDIITNRKVILNVN